MRNDLTLLKAIIRNPLAQYVTLKHTIACCAVIIMLFHNCSVFVATTHHGLCFQTTLCCCAVLFNM